MHECEGNTGFSGAAGSAYAMYVIVVSIRLGIIDNMGDVGNVKTARGDVSGDENVDFVGFEALDRSGTLGLAFVPVNPVNLETAGEQFFGKPLDEPFRVVKNDNLRTLLIDKNIMKLVKFVLGGTNQTTS